MDKESLQKMLSDPETQMRMLYAQELEVKDKEIQRLRELLRQSEAEWEAECIKLRAALIAITQVTRAPGVQPIPNEPGDWEVHRIARQALEQE